jgi:hypothetical protein
VETKSDILSELKQISPLIAEVGRQNLFKAPDNYFERLPDEILMHIKAGKIDDTLPAFLNIADKKPVFASPPDGYFESFAAKIITRIKAEETDSVDEELSILSPILSKANRNIPFNTPAGYFKELSENVIAGVKAVDFVNDELENLPTFMNDLKNKNPYQTPAEYFDKLAESILSNIKNLPQQAKVISITKRKTWLKFAAAAVIAGIITTAGFLMFNKNNTVLPAADPVAALAKVSDQEMLDYLQNQNLGAPDSSINSELAIADLSDNDNDNDAADLLSNVSDEELQQYLDKEISFKDRTTN